MAGTELGNGASVAVWGYGRGGIDVRMAVGACGSAAALCSSRRLLPAPAVIVCSALSPLPATMPPSFLSFFHMNADGWYGAWLVE